MQHISGIDDIHNVNPFDLLNILLARHGIDCVKYAPLLFEQAGLAASITSYLASAILVIVIFQMTIPGLLFSDQWRCQQSTIYGDLGLATIFLIGGLYAGNDVHIQFRSDRWIVLSILPIRDYILQFLGSWN